MKIRNGFVSNSSSSSFVIALNEITVEQLEKIKNHSEEGKKLGMEYASDEWFIKVRNGLVTGSTIMDNFNMQEFLEKIGVKNKVEWCDF